ncbi:MAG TPA: glycosyl hydrolase family 65 protein [Chthonomonadales bacterium]|nr:glycosyl hydrolase family 65 protein [Chthonomonadales bacterium]
MSAIHVFALLTLLALTATLPARAQSPLFVAPTDLAPDVPTAFPRFHFGGADEQARLLNRYLWHHFHNRLGHGLVLFNREYLLKADMWMAGAAVAQRGGHSIQEVHREDLNQIRVHPDGYVDTHQHFSHAYDFGWPFPLWTQSGRGPDEVRGVTAGWHFQTRRPAHGGWVYDALQAWNRPEYWQETATRGWGLHNVRSLGIVDERWRLETVGASPAIETPEGMTIDAFNAPILQLRWKRSGEAPTGSLPYIEWMREGDADYAPERRVLFDRGSAHWEHITGVRHSIVYMHRHPLWQGTIRRMRIQLAPGESGVTFDVDSFFTAYKTRHTINNPVYILAAWEYFRWTGDVAFLREHANRIRKALSYQETVMGGRRHNLIRNEWPGHDGRTGWVTRPDGTKQMRPGRAMGSNYFDLLPFGGEDAYATNQYHASLLAVADMEEAVRARPEWGVPLGAAAKDPADLRAHAAAVRRKANRRFWNAETGRFVACIDRDGVARDFGFTFLNLDAIWYGLATPRRARAIMDWITGRRIVAGDTSTGADIYRWRFGPRATTRRNVEWYKSAWWAPESIAFGGQIQDGGAVLGFAFYDLWARLQVLGPDDAWQRLTELLAWDKEVHEAGGYRAYYASGKRGTTLQGGGTAGGIGIDFEFFESSLPPTIVVRGFLGIEPTADALRIRPRLPRAVPSMGIAGLRYRGSDLDVRASRDEIAVHLAQAPREPLRVDLGGRWLLNGAGEPAAAFAIEKAGVHRFTPAPRGGAAGVRGRRR